MTRNLCPQTAGAVVERSCCEASPDFMPQIPPPPLNALLTGPRAGGWGLPTIRLPLYSFKNTVHLQLRDTAVRPRSENLSCTSVQVNPQAPRPTLNTQRGAVLGTMWRRDEDAPQRWAPACCCLKVEWWAQRFRASQHPAPPLLKWILKPTNETRGDAEMQTNRGKAAQWREAPATSQKTGTVCYVGGGARRGLIHLENMCLSTSASQRVSQVHFIRDSFPCAFP